MCVEMFLDFAIPITISNDMLLIHDNKNKSIKTMAKKIEKTQMEKEIYVEDEINSCWLRWSLTYEQKIMNILSKRYKEDDIIHTNVIRYLYVGMLVIFML